MNVLGVSGLHDSVPFKRAVLPGLPPRAYRIVQGLDAAAALLVDGRVVAAAAEERFSRQKGTGAFPVGAVAACLAEAGLALGDVDVVAHGFSFGPMRDAFDRDGLPRRQYAEVYAPEVITRNIYRFLPGLRAEARVVAIPHHRAHAESAFRPSGFDESLVLVSDGMGELDSTTLFLGSARGLQRLRSIRAPHSLGILYGVFTLYLGFWMNLDEYKVMGLAAHGDARRWYHAIADLVRLHDDGTYTVPVLLRNEGYHEAETYAGTLGELTALLGPPREPGAAIEQRHRDVAAALQAVLQASQMHVLSHFQRATGATSLCVAGGVGLNCSLNGAIYRSRLFERCFVQPAAGDDGTALGAALTVEHEASRARMAAPAWGPAASDAAIDAAIAAEPRCRVLPIGSPEALHAETARRIAASEVVGWFQGRMEFGPRALGFRSILADPRDPRMPGRINGLVKKREAFRPFAPAVAAEVAADYFELDEGDEETFAHMLFVTRLRPAFRDSYPAVTHVDGSARVQVVLPSHNPRFHALLGHVAEHIGAPMVLNTSFNMASEPIVCTPAQAIASFLAGGLDALAIGDRLVVRAK